MIKIKIKKKYNMKSTKKRVSLYLLLNNSMRVVKIKETKYKKKFRIKEKIKSKKIKI